MSEADVVADRHAEPGARRQIRHHRAVAGLEAGALPIRLAARQIEVGDTQDMVYIALGVPDEKRDQVAATGRTTTWIYSAYWQEYQGTRMVGFRRQVVYDPASKTYRVYHEPDFQPVYAPRSEDRIRITFQNGSVTVIEQAQTERQAER